MGSPDALADDDCEGDGGAELVDDGDDDGTLVAVEVALDVLTALAELLLVAREDVVPVELLVALPVAAAVAEDDANDETVLKEDSVKVGLGVGGAVIVPVAVAEADDKPD